MKLAGIAYVSPTFRFDPEAKLVVVQYRNTATGEVMRQSPTDKELRRRADEVTVDAQAVQAAAAAAPGAAEQRVVATVAVAPLGAASEAPSPAPPTMPAAASAPSPQVSIDV